MEYHTIKLKIERGCPSFAHPKQKNGCINASTYIATAGWYGDYQDIYHILNTGYFVIPQEQELDFFGDVTNPKIGQKRATDPKSIQCLNRLDRDKSYNRDDICLSKQVEGVDFETHYLPLCAAMIIKPDMVYVD